MLLVYAVPDLLPPDVRPDLQYVLRGWLGVVMIGALWLAGALSWPAAACAALWEAATSVCGVVMWQQITDGRALCDVAASAPVTLLAVALSVVVLSRGGRNG